MWLLVYSCVIFSIEESGFYFKPQWVVGDSWIVEISKYTWRPDRNINGKYIPGSRGPVHSSYSKLELVKKIRKNGIRYITILDSYISKEDFFSKNIEYNPRYPSECYVYYFQKNDCQLKKVERYKCYGGCRCKNKSHIRVRAIDSNPIDYYYKAGGLPLDYPTFLKKDIDLNFQFSDTLIKKLKIYKPMQETVIYEYKGKDNKKKTVFRSIIYSDGWADGAKYRKTTQYWMEGFPWWIECEVEINGEWVCSSKLIAVNGNATIPIIDKKKLRLKNYSKKRSE